MNPEIFDVPNNITYSPKRRGISVFPVMHQTEPLVFIGKNLIDP